MKFYIRDSLLSDIIRVVMIVSYCLFLKVVFPYDGFPLARLFFEMLSSVGLLILLRNNINNLAVTINKKIKK